VHVTQIECNVCRSLWSNPCPGLSPDEFVAMISISLVVQFSGFSNLPSYSVFKLFQTIA
jgi:hypothetical protein